MNVNVGFASAANIGIRTTQGKYVLLLNPDIRLNSDVIRILKEFMDTHSEAGIVGPRSLIQTAMLTFIRQGTSLRFVIWLSEYSD